MRVAITGGTGMIGTALAERLRSRGDEVLVLTRRRPRAEHEVQWDPGRGITELGRLEGLEAVFNLSGAPLADRPWTRGRRKVLWQSRVEATEVLVRALGRLDTPPRALIAAGGLGRFGDRGEELIEDDAPPGTGFLAELLEAWEQANRQGEAKLGARVAIQRMGIVLSPTGGAFPLMLKPFRLGIGGWLGDGRQYVGWVTIRDTVGAFLHLLDNVSCEGGFNVSVPVPVRNKEWSKALGRVLHRPVITHAPKWALRGALGEFADSLFLASTRVVPRKLLDSGYTFVDDDVGEAFAWLVEATRGRA